MPVNKSVYHPYCQILIIGLLILLPMPALCEIDKAVVQTLKDIKTHVQGLDSYRYVLTNITLKKGRQRKNIIKYHFKKPNEIRLEWIGPKKVRGQLAVYSNGVMKAVLSWLPFAIEINPDSNLGKGDANYPIYRSSMGSLLEQIVIDLDRAVVARIIEKEDGFVVYEIINDTNRAKIKIDMHRLIPVFIEQFDLKGTLIDGGYFSDFEENVTFPDDFFKL
jgi:outer membrane lipoprotein-sorting protein